MEIKHIGLVVPAFGYCFCCMILGRSFGTELLRAKSCGKEVLQLNCGSQKMLIAIHEAYYVAHNTSRTCEEHEMRESNHSHEFTGNNSTTEICYEDIRVPLNKGCAGTSNCSYQHIMQEGRTCENAEGIVVVNYDCVEESKLHRYCSSQPRLREGYIASPGYPLFYPHLNQCHWIVEANEGQTVTLQTLHVQLRPPTVYKQEEEYPLEMLIGLLHPLQYVCEMDILQISDRPLICGEGPHALQTMEFENGRDVPIDFSSSEFYPGGGFLLHYKVNGCSLQQRNISTKSNGSEDSYCCEECFPNNITESSRTVRCTEENTKNYTKNIACTRQEDVKNRSMDLQITSEDNGNSTSYELSRASWEKTKGFVPSSFLLDILLPSVLMGLLVFGNFVILTMIFALRKKQKAKLNTLTEVEGGESSSNERPQGNITP